jgi:hypothetical protein
LSARRYFELCKAERSGAGSLQTSTPTPRPMGNGGVGISSSSSSSSSSMMPAAKRRLRPGSVASGGGLPRGVLLGSAVLHIRSFAEAEEDDESVAEATEATEESFDDVLRLHRLRSGL